MSALFVILALVAGCTEPPYSDEGDYAHPPYGPTSHPRSRIESKYRSHLEKMEKGFWVEHDPEKTRVQQVATALRRYKSEAKLSLFRVIVGVPPDQREVGYLEREIYPPILLYNRDTGQYEATNFEFNTVRDLDLRPFPRGIILGNGRTVIAGAHGDHVLGRFSLETGTLLLLHVCPCCGAPVPKKVFFSITRPDITPDRVREFKDFMVNEHTRINAHFAPVKGLPKEFWQHPFGHKCFAAFEGARDYGFDPNIPVTFRPVRSSELRKKTPKTAEKKSKE
jgi:hypothetical protein